MLRWNFGKIYQIGNLNLNFTSTFSKLPIRIMCSENVRNPFNPCGIMVPQILRNLNLNYRFRFLEKKIWTTLDFKKFLNGILNWSPPLVRVDSSPYPLDFLEQGRLPLSTESFHKRSYLVN